MGKVNEVTLSMPQPSQSARKRFQTLLRLVKRLLEGVWQPLEVRVE